MPLQVNVTLSLPRDELTVPVARHLWSAMLKELGVANACRDDILLALTEACTNVVDHTVNGDEYEVHLTLDEERCTIDVKDDGAGFDFEDRRPELDLAENGRGIDLMNALVDCVSFTSEPQEGTIVHLFKNLEFVDDHPVRARLFNG